MSYCNMTQSTSFYNNYNIKSTSGGVIGTELGASQHECLLT